MRIVIDLDGTICEIKKEHQTYSDVSLLPGAAEKIAALKRDGHYIIIHTARHMKTCGGNVSEVIEKMDKITRQWLQKNSVVFDELVFGKPYADLYIDDLAHPFTSWDDTSLHQRLARGKDHDA